VSSLAVLAEGDKPELEVRARELSAQLGVPVVDREGGEFDLLLAVTAERLELRQPGERVRAVFVDFGSGEFVRRAHGSGRRSLLGRAIGIKGQAPRVVDATAGLGRDSMVLALLRCEVTAIERNGVVFALLEDGLQRATSDGVLSEAAGRIHLVQADGVEYLGQLDEAPEVVYLDPMFPPRKKSALPGRELQALTRVVGHGRVREAEALLAAALASGARRVVVKRGDDGAVLATPDGEGSDVQFTGRTMRFDVYLRSSREDGREPNAGAGT
jgi:16S rRNA (guanine1516-N2)-methyltransferase